jgi:hypothetical protein
MPINLSVVSVCTDVLPVLAGAWFYHHVKGPLQTFYFFFYFVTLQDYLSMLMALNGIPNVWLMNGYQFLEMLFYIFMLHQFILGNEKRTRLFLIILLLIVSWISTTFFYYERNEPNIISRSMGSIIIILYAGHLLIKLSRNTATVLFRDPVFWLASGCLIYFVFSLLVSSILPLIVGNQYHLSLYRPVWRVHSLMNIFSNLLFAIAFTCQSSHSRFPLNKPFTFSPSP